MDEKIKKMREKFAKHRQKMTEMESQYAEMGKEIEKSENELVVCLARAAANVLPKNIDDVCKILRNITAQYDTSNAGNTKNHTHFADNKEGERVDEFEETEEIDEIDESDE